MGKEKNKKEEHLPTCQCRECYPDKPLWLPDIVWRKSDINALKRLLNNMNIS